MIRRIVKKIFNATGYDIVRRSVSPILPVPPPCAPPAGLTLIRTFEELDNFVATVDNCGDPNIFLRLLRTTQIVLDDFITQYGGLPALDPFSDKYFLAEKEFFQFLSGRPYDYVQEGYQLNVEEILKGYPDSVYHIDFIDGNLAFFSIAAYLRPKKNSKYLELGYGFGNLLEVFGKAGCIVSGIDACSSFQELVKRRCEMNNIKMGEIVVGPFENVLTLINGQFDIIALDAAFHHAQNPVKLLLDLKEKMAHNGKLVILHEPVSNDFKRPWGIIRNDGETFYQIRKRGWFEAAFRQDYFFEILKHTGWHLCDTSSWNFTTPCWICELK
jgi:SAM-dependent methyltransferase